MATYYDVLIMGAQVVDGTGNAWFYGDVAIQGDRIAAITQPAQSPMSKLRRGWMPRAWSFAPALLTFSVTRLCR